MRQFNTLTGFLLSKSSNPTTDDTVTFEGYAAIGDGGAATWQHNGVTGQTPSQSPAQLSDGLLNDGSGNQWAMLLSNDFEFETFAELEASNIGNIGQRLICRERASAKYIIQPSDYTFLEGDAALSSGLVGNLQIDGDTFADHFGAIPDDSTDNSTSIQSGLNRLSINGGKLNFNGGVYRAQGLSFPDNVSIEGQSRRGTTIRLNDGANTYLMAASGYVVNSSFANSNGSISNITFDGNKANNASGSGVITRSYRQVFFEVRFVNFTEYGCVMSELSANGTSLSNGLAENSWDTCYFDSNERGGLITVNGTRPSIADGLIVNCVAQDNGSQIGDANILIDRAAGWKILNNQVYGGGFHCVKIINPTRFVMTGNHIDLRATAAIGGDTPACIEIPSFGSQGSVVISDNVLVSDHDAAASGATPTAISILQAPTRQVIIAGNSGSQSGNGGGFYSLAAGDYNDSIINNGIGNWAAGDNPNNFLSNSTNNDIGTFVPGVTFDTPGTLSPTYVARDGNYTRIGNMVFFTLSITFDTNAYAGASGKFQITGLPYNTSGLPSSSFEQAATIGPYSQVVYDFSLANLTAYLERGGDSVEFRIVSSGGNHSQVSTPHIPASTSGFFFSVSGSYPV